VALPHARQKGRLLQTHPAVVGTRASSVTATAATGMATRHSVATTYDPYAGRHANSARAVQAIFLLFGLIEGLLLFRFVLRALAANPDGGIAQAVSAITGVLLAPFVRDTADCNRRGAEGVHAHRAARLRRCWLATGEGCMAYLRRESLQQCR
jgi:hypothetical protein